MKHLSDLRAAHAGRPALVLGGGESLPRQAERAPEGCVYISANQHGCLLRACDYIVACDDKPRAQFLGSNGQMVTLKSFGVPIISPRPSMADYLTPKPPHNSSGVVAAWAAWVMGCAPILLAGMDCYRGACYWHAPKAQSTGQHLQLSNHLVKWRTLAAKHPQAMFRSMGVPLTDVFPAYDPEEPVIPTPIEAIELDAHKAKVLRAWRRFRPGQIVELTKAELKDGLRSRTIVQL